MEAIKVQQTLAKDGEIILTNLPYKKGQAVEIILLPQLIKDVPRPRLTVGQFRKLGLIGLWKGRTDIQDGATYARELREQAQHRRHINYDFTG